MWRYVPATLPVSESSKAWTGVNAKEERPQAPSTSVRVRYLRYHQWCYRGLRHECKPAVQGHKVPAFARGRVLRALSRCEDTHP